MKGSCEKCGKALGVFERSLKIDNSRVNIVYDALCADCHQVIKTGIGQIEEMYQRVLYNLKEAYGIVNTSAVDVDTLIFLGVEALLAIEPNYFSDKTSLNQTIINRSERMINKQNDMARIVHKVLLYGFKDSLEKCGLEKGIEFADYIQKTTSYIEQISMNCSDIVPQTYVNTFFSRRGFIMEKIESKSLIYILVKEDTVFNYVNEKIGATTFRISFPNINYTSNSEKFVICTVVGEEITNAITKVIDSFNQKTVRQEIKRINDILDSVNIGIIEDLKEVRPNEDINDIPLDCVLLCVVKNIQSDPDIEDTTLSDPNGLSVRLLLERYSAQMKAENIVDGEDLVDYVASNCLFATDFTVKYAKRKPVAGYGFFTKHGYIVGFIGKKGVVFVYTDSYPNDLYYPCNEALYDGRQYLYIPIEGEGADGDVGKQEETGLVFYAEEVKATASMTRYFQGHNNIYQMDNFIDVQMAVYGDHDQLMDVKRISDRLFRDFGYLPFCLYDEWYAIQLQLKKSDTLLNRLISENSGGTQVYDIDDVTYAPRIVDAFEKGAKDLQECLGINSLSVVKGLLWCYFRESLIVDLALEWKRLSGDIVVQEDNLVSAIDKYIKLECIEPERTYYLGLFIYYLMEKGIVEKTDFLDYFENAKQIFIDTKKNLMGIENNDEVKENEGQVDIHEVFPQDMANNVKNQEE